MKIRKTKKGNSIRRIVAFLLCMTMVLGLGMQDVMEQVYAEETPVTVQEGTAQDTEKITEGEQTGDEPAAPEETAPPTEETENEGSTGDTSGDGVQDEPDAGQPGEDTNTGESGGDNTGDTGTETQPGDGSTNTSGEEGNVDTPGEGEGQGTEEGDVTVPTVPEGEEGQKPAEGDATVPEGEEGQKPGEGDAAASEDTEQADAPEEEEPAEGVAFEDSYTDEKVTIQVSAEAGVIPEGAVLSVTPIEKKEITDDMSEEDKAAAEEMNAQYEQTEKKLEEDLKAETEAAAAEAAVLSANEDGTDGAAEKTLEGFLAYDISFLKDGEEVEPDGEVKVTFEFYEAVIPEGVSEDAEVSVVHLKEDASAEDGIVVENLTDAEMATVETTENAEVTKVELVTESFSSFVIYWGEDKEYWNSVTVYYVNDSNGEEIQGTRHRDVEADSGDNVVLEEYAGEIDGYDFIEARIDSSDGIVVKSIKYSQKKGWTYKETESDKDIEWEKYGSSRNVYLVYHDVKRYKTEAVNFYLNLASQILDTDGNISGQGNENFTTSVSGNQSGMNSDQGIGVPINADLQVKLPEDHVHGGVIGVIGGTSSTNAKEVDEKIRQLGMETGTNGNQSGHEDEIYQIINKNGNPAFPTDTEIFDYVRKNWKNESGGVNKGKDITVNGVAINVKNLTTDNFAIRWYVFKDHDTDCWHIDGILVPKSGVLNITKTFASKEIADAVKEKTEFKIDVTGKFLADTADDTLTISNSLQDAQEVVNEDGTVTYSWTLAIFGTQYTVSEVNYDNLEDWVYSGTDWKYTDINGKVSQGTGTNVTLNTDCQWSDDEIAKSQTLDLSNYYNSDTEEEAPYIIVNKTFKGLSWKQVQDLHDDFALTIASQSNPDMTKMLKLEEADKIIPTDSDEDAIQDYTFIWKLEGYKAGEYTVSESVGNVGLYQVNTEGVGNVNISGETWVFTNELTAQSNIQSNIQNITFQISDSSIILASLNEEKGYLIWTNERLTAGQQASVINAINSKNGVFDQFYTITANNDNCYFYYGDTLKTGISLGRGTVTYTAEGNNGKLTFTGNNAWKRILTGTYTMANDANADISVINTYTANLDLKKISANANTPIENAKFRMSKYAGSEWQVVEESIQVFNAGEKELTGLEPGVLYKLEEIEAPNSFALLTEPIYFKALNGTVCLCNAEGIVTDTSVSDMWGLSEGGAVLTIKNAPLYDLPSTGGPGIHLYMLGGVALLMAGSLLVYKKRKEEVLRS